MKIKADDPIIQTLSPDHGLILVKAPTVRFGGRCETWGYWERAQGAIVSLFDPSSLRSLALLSNSESSKTLRLKNETFEDNVGNVQMLTREHSSEQCQEKRKRPTVLAPSALSDLQPLASELWLFSVSRVTFFFSFFFHGSNWCRSIRNHMVRLFVQ